MPPSWVIGVGRKPSARCRLFCFPHAGGSASFFAPWLATAPESIEVCPVELPGRGSRIREVAYREIGPMVDALEGGLRPWLTRPFALFGHSMGALIAYELTQRFAAHRAPLPLCMCVSGNAAPHIPLREAHMHGLADDEFIRELRHLGGTPDEVFDDEELLTLVLPVLRADFAVCETYRHLEAPPLDCPILALGGLTDALIPAQHIEAWAVHTRASFACHFFAGGHFFLVQHMDAVMRLITKHVAMMTPAGGSGRGIHHEVLAYPERR